MATSGQVSPVAPLLRQPSHRDAPVYWLLSMDERPNEPTIFNQLDGYGRSGPGC
jgi:hypothetical protein